MLYLIKLKGESNTLLKIGYTENINKRLKAYKTHNPLIELIDIKEGSIIDELNLHNKLKEYLFNNSKEWFIENEEIYNIWKSYVKEDEELILELRIFKKLIEIANLSNPKDSKYLEIYIGDTNGSKKDAMFNYFFKKELHISKTQYDEGISKLIEDSFLISTDINNLFILNPKAVKYFV